jgi:hypothetical protein
MNPWVALPATGCVILAVAIGWRPLDVHPARAAKLLATVAALSVAGIAASLTATSVAFVREGASHEASHPWPFTTLAAHRPVSRTVGVVCLVLGALLLASAANAARRVWVERRGARAMSSDLNRSTALLAMAVPGRRGGVVLSRGLRHRHHRLLALSMICTAALPPLRRLDRNLRFAVERWADEEAATAVGDRRTVARTIARVAVSGTVSSSIPALSDTGVAARVEALLADPPGTSRFAGAAMLTTAGVAGSGVSSSMLQLHHLGIF